MDVRKKKRKFRGISRWKMNRLLNRGKKITSKESESMIGSRMVQRKRENENEREKVVWIKFFSDSRSEIELLKRKKYGRKVKKIIT